MSQDLSQAFGLPAASLRGLLPPRDGGAQSPRPPESPAAVPVPRTEDDSVRDDDVVGDDAVRDDAVRDDDDAEAAAGTGPEPPDEAAAPAGATRRTDSGAAGRSGSARTRRGVARVAGRDHVDLLVLLSLCQGPTDGRGVVARLREGSDGQLEAPERTVHVALHRLARHRLLGRRPDPASGRWFYALTDAGERATRARLRKWQALARGVDAVARRGGAV